MRDEARCLGTRSPDMSVRDKASVALLRLLHASAETAEDGVEREKGGYRREPGSCAIAAPVPPMRRVGQTCSDGVQHDVSARLEELRFALDRVDSVTSLEDVAGPVVSDVEPLRVRTVQMPHPRAACRRGCFDQQMEVVWHRAIRMTTPGEVLNRAREDPEPCFVVPVVSKERHLHAASRKDVKEPARHFGSELSRHDASVRSLRPAHAWLPAVVTKSAHLSRELVPLGTRSRTSAAKDADV